jgi:hypothetical protein
MARFSGSAGGEGTPGPEGPAGANGTNGADGADGADALWNFTGEYSGGAAYAVGDIATYDGQLWYRFNSNGGNVGDTPSPGLWNLLAAKGAAGADGDDGATGSPGLVYLGNYVSGNGYIANIAVVKGSDNNLYIATASGGLADPVGNTAEWSIFLPKGADGADGADGANFTGYDYEIHVSQVDGNDTTGNGDLLTPVASITKALTLVTSSRRTVIVHPGGYTESPSITTQFTTITGPGLIGGNIVVDGTISTNTGCTISGIKMTNLTVTTPTGAGNVNLLNCEVSGTFTKTSNADYVVARLCDFNSVSITGSGLVAIFGGNPTAVTVNNAGANVIVKSAVTTAPVLTAGTLSIVDSIVVAASTNAVTSSASSIITLLNSQFLTSNLSGVAPVVLNGFYSILNCVYDKPNSTLVATSGTGGSTNSIDYFQYINADKFITQGGTSSQFVKGDGSLDSTGPAGGFGVSASYHSRVDQGPQISANLVQPFTFSTTDWETGILRVNNTKIKMLSAGKYNIAFSAQLYQLSNTGTVNIWLSKNGSPMAYTNTKLVVESNAPYKVAAWNFFVDAAVDDYYEIIWSSSSTNTKIEYDAAQTINGNVHPEIPSIIVTVNQVG